MIRLVLILAVGLYLAVALLPKGAPLGAPAGAAGSAARADLGGADIPDEITLESGEVWQIDRVIQPDAVEVTEEPGLIAAADVATAAGPVPEADIASADADAQVDATPTRQPEPRPANLNTAEAPAPAPEPEPDPIAASESTISVRFVTGDRVNMRAGPSTEFDIVTALTLGTATEVLAEVEDGWFQIRDPLTGLVGFMSGDFLATQAP